MEAPIRTPLDHPYPERPHRVYATLTNHCNRACPWCSTCSSPAGNTWLDPEQCRARLPAAGEFELQLEGGEPTLHPEFWRFVEMAKDPRCTRLIVCTNGVVLPRSPVKLAAWLGRFGEALTLKLSLNHYLLEQDSGLIDLALLLKERFSAGSGSRQLVFNVRLRRGIENDDASVREQIRAAGLESNANVFYLQRYGFAENQPDWELPFLAGRNFSLINPDGKVFGPDLLARSDAMRRLS